MSEKTHLCSHAYRCKSEACIHAQPHAPKHGCEGQAPCGCWPNDPHNQPMVVCPPKDQVRPPQDCPHCGEKEAMGHHPGDCVANLVSHLSNLKQKVVFLEGQNCDLNKALDLKSKKLKNAGIEIDEMMLVLEAILDDATGDLDQPALWPIRGENYRNAKRVLGQ